MKQTRYTENLRIKKVGKSYKILLIAFFLLFFLSILEDANSYTITSTNKWEEVSPSTIYPADRNGIARASSGYGGITFRSASNSILFYDGYIGETFGDSIYANTLSSWNLEEDKIMALHITETAPTNRHTYEGFVYAETKDTLYLLKGAHRGCPGSATGMWKYSFSTNQWTEIQTNIPGGYGCEGHMAYWKEGNKLIYIDGWAQGLHEFDLNTEIWSQVSVNLNAVPANFMYESHSTWDSKRNQWIFYKDSDLLSYNPATQTFSVLLVSGTKPSSRIESGVTYIPNYDNYLIAGGKGASDTWAYDIASQAWTQIPGSSLPTGTYVHTYLQYDEKTDLVYALNSNRQFFTMRYVKSGATPDTQAPTVPTNLIAVVSSPKINLSWTASTDNVGVTGYRIYRCIGSGCIPSTQIGTAVTISYSDTGLSPSTTYTYQVSAIDAAGSESQKSIQASVTTSALPVAQVTNSITITEKAGVTTTNYPIQIGRPFIQGEIPNYPQVLVNGVPVLTQADVKTRWSDGSVKHAILSFLIPTLSANSFVTIIFRNQNTGNNIAFTSAEMLDTKYNFDAVMELTNGVTKTASARTMLQNNDFTYWVQGPIATSIILADHSTARKYDIGFDSYRPFRPILHATFWPSINKVHVRFIGEVANSEELEDVSYSLVLKTGNNPKAQVYSKSTFTHHSASRWSKEFWIGGVPTTINIDHNIAYLTATKAIPNYDKSKVISESALASAYSQWLSSLKDINDVGQWTRYMSGAGGRPDIGPYPTWTVRWLYTGDNRMKEEAFGNADLAAAWPMHLREGNATKNLLRTDPPNAGTGFGKPVSITNRPTIALWSGYDYKYTNLGDRIKVVGTMTDNDWKPDGAHQPDPFSPQYTLTGDFWYLEEMQFWASFSAARYNGAATGSSGGRGPTGAEGGIHDEVRGDGWVFRNRAQTAFFTPDGVPEKKYFETLINDAVAIWEGEVNIISTQFHNDPNWKWGNTVGIGKWDGLGVPPLRFWDSGSLGSPVDPSKAQGSVATWMQNFLIYGLGRANELGYPTGPLLSWIGKNLIGQLTDSGYDPYLIAAYRTPTIDINGRWFNSWSDVKSAIESSYNPKNGFDDTLTDPEHGYALVALGATSYVANEISGGYAWNFMLKNAAISPALNNNPKWAILPRTTSTVPVLKGDVNHDNQVDVLDIQALVNHILGTQNYGSNADVNSDGSVNILDVQALVNIILGG